MEDSDKDTINCLNCNKAVTGKFCSDCGQKKSTGRINSKHTLLMFQFGVLHFNNLIYYTIYDLAKSPGETVRNYINGKRVKYFNPLSLLFISVTMFTLFNRIFNTTSYSLTGHSESKNEYSEIFAYFIEHISYFTVLTLPVISFITYLLFKKQGYNFFELLIMEAFQQAHIWQVKFLMLPIAYLLKPWDLNIEMISLLLVILLSIRFNYYFFNKVKILRSIIYTMISILINFLLMIILTIIIIYAYKAFF